MTLSPEAKIILKNIDYPQISALHELREQLIQRWAEEGIKKETDFDTIWAMAVREGKVLGTLELIKAINM